MNSNSILLVLYYNPKFALKNETTHCCELTIYMNMKTFNHQEMLFVRMKALYNKNDQNIFSRIK